VTQAFCPLNAEVKPTAAWTKPARIGNPSIGLLQPY
jgi:hypothetical protein